MSSWFNEAFAAHHQQRLKIDEFLFEDRSQFQKITVFTNKQFGTVLALDGIVQTTSIDAHMYHEMFAHVPLCAHECPKNVLIIGGGDGGLLQEVCKHANIDSIDLVEIDEMVISVSKKYLASHSGGCFDDSRVNIIIADAVNYMKNTSNSYDIILCDSTDPIGPGVQLFGSPFYSDCSKRLRPGGILITQNGVAPVQFDQIKETLPKLQGVFNHVKMFKSCVPSYIGGEMTFAWASDRCYPSAATRSANIICRYYNELYHEAAFVLPEYLKELVTETMIDPWGESIAVDCYECNLDLISDPEKVREYVTRLVDLIDMKSYGPCHIENFGVDPKVAGISMVQLIETSCISGHFANHSRVAYIDIFSCKPFNHRKAAIFTEGFFEAQYYKLQAHRRH